MEPNVDPISGIRLLDADLPYADGSEEGLERILLETPDLSSGSDELWSKATTWPERYHLSPQRGNIVAPLRLGPGVRVLEVGAGVGAVTRTLGESLADVTAVEGNLSRARLAAIRCADLPNVEVIAGSVTSLEVGNGFDMIVAIGVLEYSGSPSGGLKGPLALLKHLVSLLAPTGVLALAIENQLGLKYLLGFDEDHLGLPWVGVEDYPTRPGVRTWSRRALSSLFDSVGLDAQRWFYPYPDYKFPHVMMSHAAFDAADAVDLIDHLVRWPATDSAEPPLIVCDDRAAHRVALGAGIGPDVANSFFLVAGRDNAACDDAVEPHLAWTFGATRSSTWMRTRVIDGADDGDRVVRTTRRWQRHRTVGWLSQHEVDETPWISGPTLERQLIEALARGDLDATAKLLRHWRSLLDAETREPDRVHRNPFVDAATDRVLPELIFDANFGNWIAAAGGDLRLIDQEWHLAGGADVELVAARALVYFAHTVIDKAVVHPYPQSADVAQLATTLGSLCDTVLDPQLLERWQRAEAQFQAVVHGVDAEQMLDNQRVLLATSSSSRRVRRKLPITALQRRAAIAERDAEQARSDLDTATARLDTVTSELQEAESGRRELLVEARELVLELWSSRDHTISIAAEIAELERSTGELEFQLREVHEYIAGLEKIRDHRDAMYRSLSWRIGQAVLRPLSLLRRSKDPQ